MAYTDESPSPPRTDRLEFSEGLPSCNSVRADLIDIKGLKIVLCFLGIGRHSRIFESDIDQVDALISRKEIMTKSCQNSAVETTREQDSHFGFKGLLRHGRRCGHVQDAQLERVRQLVP